MCGIFGAIGPALDQSALEAVFQALHHRGPDGRGLFIDEAAGVTLAHTRLAIIDLVSGAQPLESADGNIVLIANGEIYDFERIRASLLDDGCEFKTGSDSEVIIALYQRFGSACFEQLNGEFAFLLYDRARKLVIAARDRFGIKPLYVSRLDRGYVFASEMKALFASDLIDARLNPAAFDPFLEQEPDSARFPFEGISHVPPASFMVIDVETGESETVRYWSGALRADSVDAVAEPADEQLARAAESVLEQLDKAVRLRLRADVPVGLYLSGGIDSAFVGALMQRARETPVHSFSISFEGSGRNEQEFARRASAIIGTDHHELTVTKQMLWDNLAQSLWFSELPFVSLAPVGKFLLSREARKFVTVVLTGEAADEVFLGYRSFFQRALRETRNPRRASPDNSIRLRRLKLRGISVAPAAWLSLLVFHKANRAAIRKGRTVSAPAPEPGKPLINAVQEARLAAMPFDILCYLGDREEMAHSLEARLPFLDHALYNTARDIPVDLKMRDGTEKAVLREAARSILPEDLRLRRKRGFMLTSQTVDFFGTDRSAAERFRPYLTREAFERAHVFSFRAFRVVSWLARLPAWGHRLGRTRRLSNKLIMYMMQAHMLHEMFIADPPWARPAAEPVEKEPARAGGMELAG